MVHHRIPSMIDRTSIVRPHYNCSTSAARRQVEIRTARGAHLVRRQVERTIRAGRGELRRADGDPTATGRAAAPSAPTPELRRTRRRRRPPPENGTPTASGTAESSPTTGGTARSRRRAAPRTPANALRPRRAPLRSISRREIPL